MDKNRFTEQKGIVVLHTDNFKPILPEVSIPKVH